MEAAIWDIDHDKLDELSDDNMDEDQTLPDVTDDISGGASSSGAHGDQSGGIPNADPSTTPGTQNESDQFTMLK
jgi:hypothetical protein